MSNVAAIVKNRHINVDNSVYLQRGDSKENSVEAFLRTLMAKIPKPSFNQRHLKAFIKTAGTLEHSIKKMDDAELSSSLYSNTLQMRHHGITDTLMAKSFAIIREASRRVLGMRHHDVQLMGGWSMMQGMITEMATGEGKTLVATLVACAAASTGAAVHVVTTNDYLAERDAEQNMPLFNFFGLTVGIILQGMSPADRRKQYACNITYVSNKEIVFDYLKDRIASAGASASQMNLRKLYKSKSPQLLLRGLHVAIVDEADSVLIDEARTPLIISETLPDENGPELYHTAIKRAALLIQGEHFSSNAQREIWLTQSGEHYIHENFSEPSGLWSSAIWRHDLIENALKALHHFKRDQHYIISDNKVQIVDEFSGRVMPDRSWERGLHQMIEAKENCEISGQRRTLSRMTYQRFFKRYLLLCGMTGTAAEISSELEAVYDLKVQAIPTHKPSRRLRYPNQCWTTSAARWIAVADRAAEMSRLGRSVLIGTRSVEASEHLSHLLSEKGVQHAVLNARQDKEEADIIAEAGQPGRITVATNMAGRGTDIKLAQEVSEKGGLHVILTEFHESARVDRQLFGRSARQGEPGTTEAFISLEDDLFFRFASLPLQLALGVTKMQDKVLPFIVNTLVRYSQAMAEIHNARIRASTMKEDRKLQRMLAFSGTPD